MIKSDGKNRLEEFLGVSLSIFTLSFQLWSNWRRRSTTTSLIVIRKTLQRMMTTPFVTPTMKNWKPASQRWWKKLWPMNFACKKCHYSYLLIPGGIITCPYALFIHVLSYFHPDPQDNRHNGKSVILETSPLAKPADVVLPAVLTDPHHRDDEAKSTTSFKVTILFQWFPTSLPLYFKATCTLLRRGLQTSRLMFQPSRSHFNCLF